MIIRTMKNEEADAVSAIYAQSWKAAYKGFVPQAYLDALPDNRWSSILTDGGFDSLVIFDDQRIVGTSGYGKARDENFPDWGEIISIYLLPDYFGKGYGKALMDSALGAMKKVGYRQVYLWVLKENCRARRFYERYGFQSTTDTFYCEVGGKQLAEVRYVYQIS